MLAAPLSAIIKMKRRSNQHNTNGNSITTKETEGDLSAYFPLQWEKALMVQRKTVGEKWGLDHNARNWGREQESTKAVHQRVFVFCVKNTWTRSSSFYTHCSAGRASTVANTHTHKHNGSTIVVALFLNALIPFLFKALHLVTPPSIYLHWLLSVSEWVQRLYLHWTLISIVHAESFLKPLAMFTAGKQLALKTFFPQKIEDTNFLHPFALLCHATAFCCARKWKSTSNSAEYWVHETIALTCFHTVNLVLLLKHLLKQYLQPPGYLGTVPQALFGGIFLVSSEWWWVDKKTLLSLVCWLAVWQFLFLQNCFISEWWRPLGRSCLIDCLSI